MAATHSRIECGDCGFAIDASTDTPVAKTPCQRCGSTKRAYFDAMSSGQLTDHSLDTYVAHKLSQLTQCGAPELPEHTAWLNKFILTSIFTAPLPAKIRAYVFNFLRRTEGASSAYRDARLALVEYISTPQNVISPYFRALAQIEICVSQCYQGYELLAAASGHKVYEAGSGSPEEKLQTIYVDSKHMDRMIHGEKLPITATSGIWITNVGIESSRGALSFVELHKLLHDMRNLAERVSALGTATDKATE